jgi:hypothetical protein
MSSASGQNPTEEFRLFPNRIAHQSSAGFAATSHYQSKVLAALGGLFTGQLFCQLQRTDWLQLFSNNPQIPQNEQELLTLIAFTRSG